MSKRWLPVFLWMAFTLLAAADLVPTVRQGNQRMWRLTSMLVLAVTATTIAVVQQRAAARTNRPRHLCIHCGYDRSGMPDAAACPECGAGAKSVCVNCRGDMTGMEHRVCPTCGVMYGVETISKD